MIDARFAVSVSNCSRKVDVLLNVRSERNERMNPVGSNSFSHALSMVEIKQQNCSVTWLDLAGAGNFSRSEFNDDCSVTVAFRNKGKETQCSSLYSG